MKSNNWTTRKQQNPDETVWQKGTNERKVNKEPVKENEQEKFSIH